MERELSTILGGMRVEQDCILGANADVTVGFEVVLPEQFTSSDQNFEALHQALIKAIKVLPKYTVFHQQDFFTEDKYTADFAGQVSFLSRSSERFYNERPCLTHRCHIYLTKRASGNKKMTSANSSLLRKHIVPEESLGAATLQDFFNAAGQFERIINDCGFVVLKRLKDDSLLSTATKAGVVEQYCMLSGGRPMVKDIMLRDGFKIGDDHCALYTLADVNDLPSYCGPRVNYDKYSTDRTKYSIGFASVLGLLLPCNHIYNVSHRPSTPYR